MKENEKVKVEGLVSKLDLSPQCFVTPVYEANTMGLLQPYTFYRDRL